PCTHDVSATSSALRTQIDYPVGGLYHLKIVLDHHNRSPYINQTAKGGQEFADVIEMQAGGGLIENIKHAALAPDVVRRRARTAGLPRGRLQVCRQFHALRFSSRKGGCGLAQA